MKGGVLLGRKPEEGGGDSKGIICYSVLHSSSILALGLREIQTRRRRASNNKQVGILKGKSSYVCHVGLDQHFGTNDA